MYNECNGRGVQYLHNLLRFISLIAQITLVKYTHILIIYYICLSMCSRYWLTLEKFVKCITFIYIYYLPPMAHTYPYYSNTRFARIPYTKTPQMRMIIICKRKRFSFSKVSDSYLQVDSYFNPLVK